MANKKLSDGINNNTVAMQKFTKELQKAVDLSNTLLKNLNLPQIGGGGGGAGGGAGNITTSGTFSSALQFTAKTGAMALGVATGAAQALPGVQEVLGTQLLTSQARFSGVANPVALAQASMRGGQATSPTDALQAMGYGAANGLVGALPGYGGIMNGVSQLSNLTGSQTTAMRAAVGLNSAQSVNTMRMFGINVRGANGAARPASEVFKDIYNFASGQVGHKLTPQEVAISLQPGNGLANFLDAASAGNSDLRNALQLAAQQFAKGGDLSRASTNRTGLTTAAQGAQSDVNAAKLGLESAAAPSMSAGFIEAAGLLSKWNQQMADSLKSSDAANKAVKQLAKAETIAADSIGKAGLSILSVIGAYAGSLGLGKAGASVLSGKSVLGGVGRAGLVGLGGTLVGDVVGMGATHGSTRSRIGSAISYGATGAAIGSILPGIGTATGALVGGLIGAVGGLGLGASVSAPAASGANLAAGTMAVGVALTQIGTPYSWGAGSNSGPTTGIGSGAGTVGFDCSSFTRFVMSKLGVVLPRTAHDQQKCGTQIDPKNAQPGDLLFWGNPAHHVAIYAGNGIMIEAPHTGDVVKRTGVDLGSVTSCSRVINGSTGTASLGNLLDIAGGYQASSAYSSASGGQVDVNALRGNTAQDAMSGGTSSSSGLGMGASSSMYSGSSMGGSSMNKYMFINSKTGTLEHTSGVGQNVVNYGGVTVEVKVPNGAQVTAQELGKAIKAELKSLSIDNKVATK